MESSTVFLSDLPPLKRIRLMQKQQELKSSPPLPSTKKRKHESQSSSSQLPAKKRKESRTQSPVSNFSSFLLLPTKKRVWAPQPETVTVPDLNVDAEEYDDDGVLCCVCQSTDGDPADPIVFCDGCDLTVHASCYGAPLSTSVPDGDWFCQRCLSAKPIHNTLHTKVSSTVDSDMTNNTHVNLNTLTRCTLCPATDGAMKRTTTGEWAHVVCALFVPEVFFVDPEGREGIDCSKVPKKRWSEKCYVCGSCDGCALVCSEPKCGLGFHVTCAMKEDLWIEYKEGKKEGTIVAGFCKKHTEIWEKQQQSGKYKIVAEDKK